MCDLDSRRRRSKSECIEANVRKRGRDMKNQTPSPKKKDSSENNDYLELRDRLDSSRVRSNLCELPTTYISNCQTNVPSNGEDAAFSVKFSKANFVDPIYDNRPHVTTIFSPNSTQYSPQKVMNCIKNADIKKNGFSKYYLDTPVDTMSNCLDFGHFKNHLKQKQNNGISASRLDQHEVLANGVLQAPSPKKQIIHISNPSTKLDVKIRKSPMRNIYHNKESLPPRPHTPNTTQRLHYSDKYVLRNGSHINDERNSHGDGLFNQFMNYKSETQVPTCTPADSKRCKVRCELTSEKIKSLHLPVKVNKSEALQPNIKETKQKDVVTIAVQENEVETNSSNGDSTSKRNRVRPRSDSDNSDELPPEVESEACSVITKKAREGLPLENKKELHLKSVVKLSSIKNRHKISAIKLRKVRNKIAHSVSSDSNLSDSDFEELEEDYEKRESVESVPEETVTVTEDIIINGTSPSNKTTTGNEVFIFLLLQILRVRH